MAEKIPGITTGEHNRQALFRTIMTQKNIHDVDALLLYRVGPVYCCSSTFFVESVIMSPRMTRSPGATVAEPGVFKTAQGIVKAVDLRKRFGANEKDWAKPGRIVVIEAGRGFAGLWVDEIAADKACVACGYKQR